MRCLQSWTVTIYSTGRREQIANKIWVMSGQGSSGEGRKGGGYGFDAVGRTHVSVCVCFAYIL